MVNLQLTFNGRSAGEQLRRKSTVDLKKVQDTISATADTVSTRILSAGRADIQGAGNYGAKWVDGLQAVVDKSDSNKIVIRITHSEPMFPFLMKGGVIKGHPLLWVPAPWATDTKGLTSAADYPGRLVRVTTKAGQPALVAPKPIGEVKYLGFTSLRIPQKFHTLEIIRDIAKQMPDIYKRLLGSA
jgi:hypothetical protein